MPRWIDPRVVLLALFFGLLATVGLGLGVLGGVLAAAGTLVAGTAATALTTRRGTPHAVLPATAAAAATAQARLLADIGTALGHIDALGADGTLVPAVQAQADEAAVVGRSALTTAAQVAAAADRVDEAAGKLAAVGQGPGTAPVRRLDERRALLLRRLEATAAQLLGVYADLVETNATLATSGLVAADEEQALGSVSTSLDDLRVIAAELETLGRRDTPGA